MRQQQAKGDSGASEKPVGLAPVPTTGECTAGCFQRVATRKGPAETTINAELPQ